jgi:putative flippase GtrA
MKAMGGVSYQSRVGALVVVVLMCLTCVLPFSILWVMLNFDFDKPIFTILLIVVGVGGYFIWNFIYNKMMVKKE